MSSFDTPVRARSLKVISLLLSRKSPAYFIWARDICAVQESWWTPEADELIIIQVTVKDEERLPEDGSYAKSRTRATVELSAWTAKKVEKGTELAYVVKIHLNGSIPTSVVQMISLETPMCVGRVRDTYYELGHVPLDNTPNSKPGTPKMKTVSVSQTFEDDSGERKWIGEYVSAGADDFTIFYDKERMYSGGVNVVVESKQGSDVSAIKTTVDEAESIIKVEIPDSIKQGTYFEIITTPS